MGDHATLILVEVFSHVAPGLRNSEVVAASLFYQFTLYIAVRLAHHGFTLGELSLVSFGATVLFMEMMNLTTARVSLVYYTMFLSFNLTLSCGRRRYGRLRPLSSRLTGCPRHFSSIRLLSSQAHSWSASCCLPCSTFRDTSHDALPAGSSFLRRSCVSVVCSL